VKKNPHKTEKERESKKYNKRKKNEKNMKKARLALGRECGRVVPVSSLQVHHALSPCIWPCGPMPAHQDDARWFTHVRLMILGYRRINLPLFLFLFLRRFFFEEKKILI